MHEKDRRRIKYRIKKANETFDEISLHISNGLWNTSVNRLYYSCYYAVTALLIDNEIRAITHSGIKQMFGLHFVKTGIIEKELGKFYSDIFDMWQAGDHKDYIEYVKEDVLDLLPTAKNLIFKIESLLENI